MTFSASENEIHRRCVRFDHWASAVRPQCSSHMEMNCSEEKKSGSICLYSDAARAN